MSLPFDFKFVTIFPDLDYLNAFKNPQLFKMYTDFGEVKRAYKSEVKILEKRKLVQISINPYDNLINNSRNNQ